MSLQRLLSIPTRVGTVIVFGSLAAAGCVRVSATQLAPGVGRMNPDSVSVFAVNRPERYTELAILRSHRFLVTDGKVLNALRKRAAAMGANGLLLINTDNSATQRHTGTGVIIAGRNSGNVVVGNGQTSTDVFERAVAIRWSASNR